jgi:O-acetyl-ADP-ribose deacetylase (regulator of RNase III)
MQQDQQQSAKETTIFALNNDYYKSLLYFELETTENCINILNETNLKLVLNANELISNHLQSIYVLHGNKKLLIVCKPDSNPNHVAQSILNIFEENKQENFHLLKRKCIPFYHNSSRDELSHIQQQNSSQPLLLVAEVNDAQLKLINADDKNSAIKAIESKTGLKLKKSKKTFYFSGLLFQFVILNDFLNEKSAMNTSPVQITQEPLTKSKEEQTNLVSSAAAAAEELVEQIKQEEAKAIKTDLDWHDLYLESSIRGHFMLKPKPTDDGPDLVDFFYDVFIFEADLTDLNTDGIVNAANPNLHPGYIGDGISRRIREKAGKQMQDACKRIIRQDRNNVLVRDSEVVFTKSYGKLKSKYVLHSVAPTWTKYVASVSTNNSNESSPSVSLSSPSSYSSSSSSSSSSYKQQQQQQHQVVESNEKFETLLEQTFVNLFKQAHDSKLQLNSIAIPVMSTSLGGAFDIPLELCAHILYTQLVDFKLTNDLNKNLKTICITSLETNTVKVLCDIFSNYTECYAKSTWALPLSPFSRLLNIALEEKQQNQQEVVNEVSREVEQEQVIDEEPEKIAPKVIEPEIINEPAQEPSELISSSSSSSKNQNTSNNLTNISVTVIQQENSNENSTCSRIISLNETNIVKNQPLSLITIKNNNQRQPRTMSNSSSNSSSHNHEQQNNTYYYKQSDQTNKNNRNNFNNNSNGNEIVECLFCQKEIKNKLISCGSQNCIAVFCYSCITNYLTNQKTQKCPACRMNFDKNILNSLNKQNSTHLPVHERLSFNTNSNNNTEYLNNNYHQQQQQHISKNAITDAKIYVKVLDEPCDGYEKFRTLIVTFEVDDGIQNVN